MHDNKWNTACEKSKFLLHLFDNSAFAWFSSAYMKEDKHI